MNTLLQERMDLFMDNQTSDTSQVSPKRARRKRSKYQVFKEAYLPLLIILLAAVLVIVFIAGSISRANTKKKLDKEASIAASESLANLAAQQEAEVQDLIARAEELAAKLDYQGAIDLLDTFSGDSTGFPDLVAKRAAYVQAMSELQTYSNPSEVPNLSFQMLIADPARAFADETYGNAYNRNYVTTDEFSKILQQLYDNGYMLVSLHDLVATTQNADGDTVFTAGTLYLPAGKKPIVLTQTAANYFTYMTDGNEDGLPDKDGDGFPYQLALDDNGNFISRMIDGDGQEVTGNFDFVTILEAFIREHPDFSYQGARAVLAVTGYDGVFGYRTNPNVKDSQGSEYYAQQLSGAGQIVSALKDAGYELACYSYNNISYGDSTADELASDLAQWNSEVAPVLGNVDILVYPYGDDIVNSMEDTYTGEKFQTLYQSGFRYFVGMDHSVKAQAQIGSNYFRDTRRLVSGSRMAHSADVFSDLFDAAFVLSSERGEVPSE